MEIGEQIQHLVNRCRKLGLHLVETENELRKRWLVTTLTAHHFNECSAARELGVHRNTLKRECHRLGVDVHAMRVAAKRTKKPVRSVYPQTSTAAMSA